MQRKRALKKKQVYDSEKQYKQVNRNFPQAVQIACLFAR